MSSSQRNHHRPRNEERLPQVQGRRAYWLLLLLAIIVAGVLSRVVRTGAQILDKYLGDALYAAMVYAILRLTGRVTRVAVWAAVAMLLIELFQLTGIPAEMLRSHSAVVRICARLLGTHFGWLDLTAYAAGIGCISVLDRSTESSSSGARRGATGRPASPRRASSSRDR